MVVANDQSALDISENKLGECFGPINHVGSWGLVVELPKTLLTQRDYVGTKRTDVSTRLALVACTIA